jgi:hypothetical protein
MSAICFSQNSKNALLFLISSLEKSHYSFFFNYSFLFIHDFPTIFLYLFSFLFYFFSFSPLLFLITTLLFYFILLIIHLLKGKPIILFGDSSRSGQINHLSSTDCHRTDINCLPQKVG